MVIDSRNSSILPKRGALLKVNQVEPAPQPLRARDPGQSAHPASTDRFSLTAKHARMAREGVSLLSGSLAWTGSL